MKKEFENEYTLDTNLIKEYVYNVLCKNHIIISLIIAIIGIIILALSNISKPYIILIITTISICYSIIIPILTTKQLEKIEKNYNDGKIEKTNIKFQKKIIMNEGKIHLEFDYKQIKKVVNTKNIIILKINNKSAILVLKNGFVKGNKKDFIEFIENKINNNNSL